MSVLQNDNLCWYCEVIFWGHCKTEAEQTAHCRFERSPTVEHFHFADHGFLSHASICCLKHNHEWSDSTRKLRESYWIRRLHTLLCPLGINKVTDSIWPYGRTPYGTWCAVFLRQSSRRLAML